MSELGYIHGQATPDQALRIGRNYIIRQRNRRYMIAAIVAVGMIVATSAFATPWTIDRGDGAHIPNPECTASTCGNMPPTPDNDRDPVAPLSNSPAYGFCCAVDGVNRYHAAFGRDDATARRDCAARVARLGQLPKCDPWIANAVRGLK